jgi:hypothetical protein
VHRLIVAGHNGTGFLTHRVVFHVVPDHIDGIGSCDQDGARTWNNHAPRRALHAKGFGETMSGQRTVREVTHDLLRSLGRTTGFGNLGSTEQTFLKDFPDVFTYVLGLQE